MYAYVCVAVIRGLCDVYYHVCHRVVIFGSTMCLKVIIEVNIFCVKNDLERVQKTSNCTI